MKLGTMKQGRNSNGKPRPEKYMVNIDHCADLIVRSDRIGDALN
jgi:hypothetical protein